MRIVQEDAALVLEGMQLPDTERVGAVIARELQDGDVVLLEGTLGAGKTTLAQAIARGLGITQDVVSPTFTIACLYEGTTLALNHFDLYRLQSADQLDDVDFWSLVDEFTPGASLIEWADLFPDEMPDDALVAALYVDADGARARTMCLTPSGTRAQSLLSSIERTLREMA